MDSLMDTAGGTDPLNTSPKSSSPGLSEWFGDSTFDLRGQSFRPDPREPEAFLFKMRSFFGINARAESFTWLLLASRSGHPAWIARETGWGAKTVQVVLNEMAESGLVHLSEGEREKRFRIDVDHWRFVLPSRQIPAWWSQLPFFEACFGLSRLLDELAQVPDASDAAKAVKIRELRPKVMNDFVLAKQAERFDTLIHLRGGELVEAVKSATVRLIADIMNREGLMISGEHLLR